MTSQRYKENFALIDWSDFRPRERARQAPPERSGLAAPLVMNDISEFQSPIDFSLISSRSALREHERKYGVRQCGELKSVEDFDNNAKPFKSAIPD
jgi:hypothetical protein